MTAAMMQRTSSLSSALKLQQGAQQHSAAMAFAAPSHDGVQLCRGGLIAAAPPATTIQTPPIAAADEGCLFAFEVEEETPETTPRAPRHSRVSFASSDAAGDLDAPADDEAYTG